MKRTKANVDTAAADEGKFEAGRPVRRKKDNLPLVFTLIMILCAVLFAMEFVRRMIFAE